MKIWTSAFTASFKVIWNQSAVLDLALSLVLQTSKCKYRSSLFNREVFSTLFAVQFWPQVWAWLLLRKSISDPDAGCDRTMESPRRTTSSSVGHLGGNHHSASTWADGINSCDWAPIRNVQLLHDTGEPRSHPEVVFLWRSIRDNVTV